MTFREISEVNSLEELCLSIQDGDWIESKDQSSAGYRLLQIGNIAVGKFRESGKPRYVSEDTFRRLNCTKIQIGDVLIARMPEPTGRAWCVDSPIPDSITSVDVAIVRVNPTKLDAKYLSYFLNQKTTFELIASLQTGSTRQRIKRSDLAALEIRTHSLDIQRAIANILSNLDKKIATNDAVSETLEDIAQTIFKSWFIDFDPVKAKMAGEKPVGMDEATAALFPDSMEESELGLIPSGWKVGQLNSILKLNKSTVKAGTLTESVPYVPIDQIGAKDVFLKNSLSGSEAKTSLVSFKKDDILFGAMRPYFHKVALAPFDGTTRTTTFVLRAINPEYLTYSLFAVYQDEAVAYATNNSQGTTIPYAIWKNSFENYPIALPPERIAKAFNDLVIPIITFGYSLIAQNQKLVAIRDQFLPRLISGELQIPEEMLVS